MSEQKPNLPPIWAKLEGPELAYHLRENGALPVGTKVLYWLSCDSCEAAPKVGYISRVPTFSSKTYYLGVALTQKTECVYWCALSALQIVEYPEACTYKDVLKVDPDAVSRIVSYHKRVSDIDQLHSCYPVPMSLKKDLPMQFRLVAAVYVTPATKTTEAEETAIVNAEIRLFKGNPDETAVEKQLRYEASQSKLLPPNWKPENLMIAVGPIQPISIR